MSRAKALRERVRSGLVGGERVDADHAVEVEVHELVALRLGEPAHVEHEVALVHVGMVALGRGRGGRRRVDPDHFAHAERGELLAHPAVARAEIDGAQVGGAPAGGAELAIEQVRDRARSVATEQCTDQRLVHAGPLPQARVAAEADLPPGPAVVDEAVARLFAVLRSAVGERDLARSARAARRQGQLHGCTHRDSGPPFTRCTPDRFGHEPFGGPVALRGGRTGVDIRENAEGVKT
jgi:hypothetical protein